jgi:methylated-DNA-[protein]-cysteine S-methyltransferase
MSTAVFTLVDAPWGPIHVAASDAGVAALDLMAPTEGFLDALRRRGFEPYAAAAAAGGGRARDHHLERVVDHLRTYLRGALPAFDDVPLDLGSRPGWDRAVLGGVRAVPWGQVTTYGRIARRIGRPGAARAVGGAVGRNPVGILIPCHRVIAGDGSIGGYGGAWFGTREALLDVKRELLALEGVRLPARRFAD